MRLLLDTHVLIWWDMGQPLRAKAGRAIQDAEQVFVSAVTGWEIALKTSLGKLQTRRSVVDAVAESGFEELPVRLAHTEHLGRLPWHHRDPFDRLLAVQALSENLTLVTRDRVFRKYGLRILAA